MFDVRGHSTTTWTKRILPFFFGAEEPTFIAAGTTGHGNSWRTLGLGKTTITLWRAAAFYFVNSRYDRGLAGFTPTAPLMVISNYVLIIYSAEKLNFWTK